ncbi:hypothetical protein MXB_2125 [Myxobolus squamalis]|nr:hypothetical protein MXB_2125 [Myxobolus squamalis]
MTITRECFLHSFPDDYPDLDELNQAGMEVNHLSRRKVLKRLKTIDNYDKTIKKNLIDIITNYCHKTYIDFKIIRKFKDDTNYWNNCQLNSFLPIGIIMSNKGIPEKLSMLFSHEPTKNQSNKKDESYIIGCLTDGDISLNMGKGIGKGLVLAKAFSDLKIIHNDPKCRYAVLKNLKSSLYHQCKIFINVKLYL